MSGLLIANHKVVPFVSMAGGKKPKKQKGKGLADNLAKGLNFLKDTQLLSNGLKLINNDKAKIAGDILSQVGLGKKKRKAKKQKGAGFLDSLGSGIGNAFSGVGQGLGAAGFGIGRGIFGSGRKGKKKMINM